MRKIILLTVIGLSIIISGCSNGNSQTKLKRMNEIEKLTKEQFIEETAAIHNHVFDQMNKLLDRHKTIDVNFENDINKLHNSSVTQMIEYGKVLAKKDEETRSDYITSGLMAMWDAMEEKGTEASDDFEEKFDKRMPEFEAYGSEDLGRKLNDLFGIMDFMNLEDAKEMHPETAKEFGIE